MSADLTGLKEKGLKQYACLPFSGQPATNLFICKENLKNALYCTELFFKKEAKAGYSLFHIRSLICLEQVFCDPMTLVVLDK